jgi:hypothetical protein
MPVTSRRRVHLIKNAVALAASIGFVIGCTGSAPSTVSPTSVATAPGTSLPTAVPTSAPSAAATARATATPAAATPAALESALEGTWSTGPTSCDQQNAAVEEAGFTADETELAGWDPETCGNMMHGSEMELSFSGSSLTAFQDGSVGWSGSYQLLDDSTFEAGDSGDFYITYEFELDGTTLIVDMVDNDFPAASEEELLGETLAQTVIYESAPFTRQGP